MPAPKSRAFSRRSQVEVSGSKTSILKSLGLKIGEGQVGLVGLHLTKTGTSRVPHGAGDL